MATEPVKEILRIFMCIPMAVPVGSPKPETTLATPGGKPASLIRVASFSALRGAFSEGFENNGVAADQSWGDLEGEHDHWDLPLISFRPSPSRS